MITGFRTEGSTAIADAPWIREAEMYGVGDIEDEFPASDIADDISIALDKIESAYEYLGRAAQACDGTPYEDFLYELYDRLEDFQTDLKAERNKVAKGVRL